MDKVKQQTLKFWIKRATSKSYIAMPCVCTCVTFLDVPYLLEYKSQLQRLFSLLLSMMRLILRISRYRRRSMV